MKTQSLKTKITKTVSLLTLLASILTVSTGHANLEDLRPMGGVLQWEHYQLFLACEDDCQKILVVEDKGEADDRYRAIRNTVSRDSLVEMQNLIKQEIRDEAKRDHQLLLLAGTKLSLYGLGYVAEETGLFEGFFENNPAGYVPFMIVAGLFGVSVDVVKVAPQGVVYGSEHLLAIVEAWYFARHLENTKKRGVVKKVGLENYDSVKDALYELPSVL